MLNFLFRMMLTVSATFWVVIVYGIKEQWTFCIYSTEAVGLALILVPVVLSMMSLWMSRIFDKDSIKKCEECVLADNDFLPVYLGYFFIALSINDFSTLCFVYAMIFLFTFLTQTQYFNPMFLLFGYHFYHVVTLQKTKVFLIVKGNVIRNVSEIEFADMRRLNDTTYIVRKDK